MKSVRGKQSTKINLQLCSVRIPEGMLGKKKKNGRVGRWLRMQALIWKQIEGWKDKLLSRAVKDILIKAVA
jgi:hypothetical protein